MDREIQQLEDEVRKLQARGDAALAAKKRELEEFKKRAIEEIDSMPKMVGRQNDIKFGSDGRIIPETIGRVIHQWDDGRGNTVFTMGITDYSQIRALSERITAQRTAFDLLGDEEKARIRKDFGSSKRAAQTANPYGVYLQSEALGKRFMELKQNPPRPSFLKGK